MLNYKENIEKFTKQKKKEKQELDEVERKINEGIENGTIPAVVIRRKENYEYAEIPFKQEYMICEEETAYYFNDYVKYPHDKLIKTILSDKKEVSKVIEKYVGIKVSAKQLQKYKSSYIEKDFKSLESDIVYKMKDRKIFFLIEHQSKVDKTMPYRIYQYISAIMREAVARENQYEEGYLYPKVIPIVIYTGNEKWNVKTSLSEVQEEIEGYEFIENTYKLINANDYTEESLLNDETITSKAMLVERTKDKEKMEQAIAKVIEKITKENEIEAIYKFLNYIWQEKISKEAVKEFSIKLREKGGVKMTGLEILYQEYNRKFEEGVNQGINQGISQGISQGIKRIIKNMINKNLSIKEISNLTGVNEKKVKELKEEIESME